jgi:hypothetical protein
VRRLKKKCIIYVGLTRVGKSTCFNWAARKVLRGIDEDGRIIFKLVSEDGAQMAPGQLSVTLVFNEEEYDKETSLIDLAGWGDKRNYTGVYGVSYNMKAVFDTADEVKFLITFSRESISSMTGDELLNTLRSFVKSFNLKDVNPEIKE